MKKSIFLALVIILLNITAFSQTKVITEQVKNNPNQLIDSWKEGTSTGIFTDFSQNEFNEAKFNTIEYIELGSSVFRNKTQEESEEWVKDLKTKLDNAGIVLWSVHLPFSRVLDISTLNDEDRDNMIKECLRIMALCKPMNPQKFIIHPSSEPITDEERPVRLKNCIASLKILSEEVKKYNAQLVVEDLPRTCLGNNSDEILAIVKAVGNGLGICFDTNHLLMEKPEEFVLKAGNLITTVHISDYDGIDERHWLPGEGIIDWNNIISILVKNGYNGPFMYETSRSKPASDSVKEQVKLTSLDLRNNFRELKHNYINSAQ